MLQSYHYLCCLLLCSSSLTFYQHEENSLLLYFAIIANIIIYIFFLIILFNYFVIVLMHFSCLCWKSNSGEGFTLEYPSIYIHAVSRDLNNFPEECLYLMIDGKISMPVIFYCSDLYTNFEFMLKISKSMKLLYRGVIIFFFHIIFTYPIINIFSSF